MVLIILVGATLVVKRKVTMRLGIVGFILALVALYTRRYSDWHLPAPAPTNVRVMVIRLVALGLLFFFVLNNDD